MCAAAAETSRKCDGFMHHVSIYTLGFIIILCASGMGAVEINSTPKVDNPARTI